MAGCSDTSSPVTKRMQASNPVEQFVPFTNFRPAVGLDAVRAKITRKSVTTAGSAPTLTFKLAYRIAEIRPDNPGSWQTIAGFSVTGAGEDMVDVNCASITAGNQWVQWGISMTLGGTTPIDGQADVELVISSQTCGSSAGTRSQELNTFNTQTNTFVAITGWLPTLGVDKVVAFFIISGLANSLRLQLAYRKATTSTQSPGAWALLEGAAYRTGDGETSTGEIGSLGLTTSMYVQFGIAYSQVTAANTPGTASVTTTVWTRRT